MDRPRPSFPSCAMGALHFAHPKLAAKFAMTSPSIPPNAYTDAPEQHPNLVLGSLQLLFWLFFRPAAWRNHIARIDPTLRPDFCWSELSIVQWRNRTLRQVLLQGHLVLPLLVGGGVGLSSWRLGLSGEAILYSVAFSLAGGVTFSVLFGVAGSVLVGVAGGVLVSVVNGVIGSVAGGVVDSVRLGVAVSVVLGMAGSVAGGIVNRKTAYSLTRQTGGILVGFLIGIVAVGVANSAADLAGGVTGVLAGGGLDGVSNSVSNNIVGSMAGVVANSVAGVVVVSVAGVVAVGVAGGVRTRQWRRSFVYGVAGGVVVGVAVSVASGATAGVAGGAMLSGVAFSVAGSVVFGTVFVLPYAIAERIAGSWAGAIAGSWASSGVWLDLVASRSGIFADDVWGFGLMGLIIGLTLPWWRPILFYPLMTVLNTLIYRLDEQRPFHRASFLQYHSAFWDEYQWLPLLGLDSHLVLVTEHNLAEGKAAIDYLSASRQRWAAQAAQIELDARQLEHCADATAIGRIHKSLANGELEGATDALFRSFNRISEDVNAALNQASAYNQRLALTAVGDRLDGLLRELTRSSDKYAVRFRPIAQRWSNIVEQQLNELTKAAELRQEIDSPYIIGVPLTEQQEIFVGRTDISAQIEQLLLDRRRPPLLLYGQRRTGKTSLLNNLGRLLPNTIIPMFVDLQGPASRASDHTGFLYNIARGMLDSAKRQGGLTLPALSREILAVDPFTSFDEWLDQVEQTLGQNTALLALDEFEVLDKALTDGRFNEADVLGLLRNLIQHRPRFKVLVSGNHTLQEFQRWASYLINAQVVHLGYLQSAETRQLIEHPVKDFALRYQTDASQRVLELTRGHPFLVQLLCAEIVALKNEQDPSVRRLATLADVEAAVPEALSSGGMFFSDIEGNQVDAGGLAVLRYLAAQGEGAVVSRDSLAHPCPENLDPTLDQLLRRELIEPVERGYRFQVDLIRRWFA